MGVELVVVPRAGVPRPVVAEATGDPAGPLEAAVAVARAPDVPDDALKAGGEGGVGVPQVQLSGRAVQRGLGSGLGRQHLVLQLGAAGPQPEDVELVVLVEVL